MTEREEERDRERERNDIQRNTSNNKNQKLSAGQCENMKMLKDKSENGGNHTVRFCTQRLGDPQNWVDILTYRILASDMPINAVVNW